MNLRNYQLEAVQSLFDYFDQNTGNPLISMPTGSGKSHVIAGFIARVLKEYPDERMILLTHVKELIVQDVEKIHQHIPLAPLEIFSAGLKSKRFGQITAASIQSIYRRACDMEPVSIIIIDEAHLLSPVGTSRYQKFIRDMRLCNPCVKVIGLTASPFRLGTGLLTEGKDRIFTDIAYVADIRRLIEDGYLCPLTTKAGVVEADLSNVHKSGGEFKPNELEAAMDREDLVSAAISEIIKLFADRKSWLIFGSGVRHSQHLANEICKYGIEAKCVHGETPAHERDQILKDFKAGRLRAVTNANLWTTGMDASNIDALAMLRPTASAGLYLQMCGRAFRVHPGKKNALIADFAGNVERHGPVDMIDVKGGKEKGDGVAPTKVCPECREIVFAGVRECPACGFQWPPPELKHNSKPSNAPILSISDPWLVQIKSVDVCIHRKQGKPDSLKVTYAGDGMIPETHNEWLCPAHGGYAADKFKIWWLRRFPGEPVPTTAAEALMSRLSLANDLAAVTKYIKVKRNGKYTEILGVTLHGQKLAIAH